MYGGTCLILVLEFADFTVREGSASFFKTGKMGRVLAPQVLTCVAARFPMIGGAVAQYSKLKQRRAARFDRLGRLAASHLCCFAGLRRAERRFGYR